MTAVSGETATCAQVVSERANTVGLLLVRLKRFKPRSAVLPNSDESESLSDMVGLVPSMVRYKCRSLFDMVVGRSSHGQM